MIPEEILLTAADVISKDRHDAYGDYEIEAGYIATGWTVITRQTITAQQVPLMMAWLKIVRQAHQAKDDNLVDLAGYAALAARVHRTKAGAGETS